jgi:diguanylate cyclase (GGDEF)-like protein/PAS domain S-box-containing protein
VSERSHRRARELGTMGSLGGLSSLRNKFLIPFLLLTLALSSLLGYWMWERESGNAQRAHAESLNAQQRTADQLKFEIEAFSQRTAGLLVPALSTANASDPSTLSTLAAVTPPSALRAIQFGVSSPDRAVKIFKPLSSTPLTLGGAEPWSMAAIKTGWNRLSATGQLTAPGTSPSYLVYRAAAINGEGRVVGFFDSLHHAADVFPATAATTAPVAALTWGLLGKIAAVAALPLVLFGALIGLPLYKALREIDYLAYVVERFRVGTPLDQLPMQRPDEIGRIARAVAALSMRVAKTVATHRAKSELGTAVSAAQEEALEKQKQALARSMEQVRQFAAVVEAAYEGIIILDRRYRIEYANPAFANDFRMPVSTLKGIKISDLFHTDAVQTIEHFEPVLDLGIVVRETVRCKRADSVELYAELTASPVRDESGSITGIVVVERDVTATIMSSELMTQQLLIDPLTEVWRRSALLTDLERRAARSERTTFSVLFVDLDGFKSINDRFGHEAGDTVLRSVGGVLKSQIRENDVVGRYGGDEFLIVVDDDAKESNARRIAQRVVAAIPTVTGLRYPDVRFAASIGIACFPRDADTVADLVRSADHAMYAAKRAGGSRFVSWADVKNKPSWSSAPPAAEVLTLRRRG